MRFLGFDLARSLAVVLLLTAHVGQAVDSPFGGFFGIPGFYRVSLGGVAVTVFLVVSGAVLQLRHGKTAIHYRQFITRRVLRIYPVYYLALLIGVCLYAIESYIDTGSAFAGFSQLHISDIVLSITGLYSFTGGWGGPFVETSWFVALIMTMYAAFPLLSSCIKKRPFSSLVSLLIVSTVSRLLLGKFGILPQRPLDWFPLCRIFEFSLGIWLGTVLPKWTYDFGRGWGPARTAVLFVGALSFPLFLVHYPLLRVVRYLDDYGVDRPTAIGCFLVFALLMSWIVLVIDRRIPRARILGGRREQRHRITGHPHTKTR